MHEYTVVVAAAAEAAVARLQQWAEDRCSKRLLAVPGGAPTWRMRGMVLSAIGPTTLTSTGTSRQATTCGGGRVESVGGED